MAWRSAPVHKVRCAWRKNSSKKQSCGCADCQERRSKRLSRTNTQPDHNSGREAVPAEMREVAHQLGVNPETGNLKAA